MNGGQDIIPELSADLSSLDYETRVLVDGFYLSIVSGFLGAEIDYNILKDFCKRHKLDSLEVLAVYKQAVAKMRESN